MTTRRLSAEIQYSQPVIYKSFASMDEIVEAVALEGFAELAQALTKVRRAGPAETVASAARAYMRWATRNPTLYDAMFSRPTRLRFADETSAAPLQSAFSALRAAVEPIAGGRDVDTLTEVLWSTLHGLTTLARNQRLRPGHARQRVELLVASIASDN